MKYLVLLCDGMADVPNSELSNKTPMECANKPFMDSLAKSAEIGMCKTVAKGLKPGSDVANLSVLGYDPLVSYTGRSPLEAASIGIDLKDSDVTLRCNTVTLSDEEVFEEKTMVDYCAGDISTEEARSIIETIEQELGNDIYKFDFSYRGGTNHNFGYLINAPGGLFLFAGDVQEFPLISLVEQTVIDEVEEEQEEEIDDLDFSMF